MEVQLRSTPLCDAGAGSSPSIRSGQKCVRIQTLEQGNLAAFLPLVQHLTLPVPEQNPRFPLSPWLPPSDVHGSARSRSSATPPPPIRALIQGGYTYRVPTRGKTWRTPDKGFSSTTLGVPTFSDSSPVAAPPSALRNCQPGTTLHHPMSFTSHSSNSEESFGMSRQHRTNQPTHRWSRRAKRHALM